MPYPNVISCWCKFTVSHNWKISLKSLTMGEGARTVMFLHLALEPVLTLQSLQKYYFCFVVIVKKTHHSGGKEVPVLSWKCGLLWDAKSLCYGSCIHIQSSIQAMNELYFCLIIPRAATSWRWGQVCSDEDSNSGRTLKALRDKFYFLRSHFLAHLGFG